MGFLSNNPVATLDYYFTFHAVLLKKFTHELFKDISVSFQPFFKFPSLCLVMIISTKENERSKSEQQVKGGIDMDDRNRNQQNQWGETNNPKGQYDQHTIGWGNTQNQSTQEHVKQWVPEGEVQANVQSTRKENQVEEQNTVHVEQPKVQSPQDFTQHEMGRQGSALSSGAQGNESEQVRSQQAQQGNNLGNRATESQGYMEKIHGESAPMSSGSAYSGQQKAYCTWEPAQTGGQRGNSSMNQNGTNGQQTTGENHYYYAQTGNMPPMQPIGGQKKKKEKKARTPFLTKRAAALLLVIGLVVGGGLGTGGALIASNLNQEQQSQQTSGAPAQEVNTVTSGANTVEQVVEKTADSVVEINTEMVTAQMMGQYVSEGAGSGVIISKDGYIVTNNHVIEGAEKITVRLKNGNTYDAQLIGRDEETDIAIIKIEATEDLTVATLGDSSSLKVGEMAIAIGNPLGQLGGTVTTGIISALDREITLNGEQMNLLQTNAAINPGNSGGGLFDSEGNLIGIVVAKSSGSDVEGLGFAIPIDDVKTVINELIDYGYVVGRTELGVTLVDIDTQQAAMMYRVNQLGTYILQVNEASAAEKAGLQVGDRVISFGGTQVSSSSDISNALDSYQAGDQVKMTVQRGEETLELTVTLEQKVS